MQPTNKLRFVKRFMPVLRNESVAQARLILQQQYSEYRMGVLHLEWRDVPGENENEPSKE